MPRFRLTIEKLFPPQIGDLWFHFETPFRFLCPAKDNNVYNVHPQCIVWGFDVPIQTQLMASMRSANSFSLFITKTQCEFPSGSSMPTIGRQQSVFTWTIFTGNRSRPEYKWRRLLLLSVGPGIVVANLLYWMLYSFYPGCHTTFTTTA